MIIKTLTSRVALFPWGASDSTGKRAHAGAPIGSNCLVRRQLVGASLLVLVAQSASATDSVRCGRSIVRVGDLLGEVLQKCGEPTYRSGNYIVYDMGPASFRRQFLIQSNRVVSIRVGQKF